MTIKTKKEIKIMREGGKILAEILLELKKASKPGVNTLEIDYLAEKLLKRYHASPSFKNYKGYKYATCLSVNEEVVHGVPGRHTLCDKDILSIDLGVYYKGLHTDAATTFAIEKISKEIQKLINTAKKSLDETIKMVVPGVRLGTLQANISEIIERNGFKVIKDLSGHGVGKKLQEEPPIPNFGVINSGIELKKGMTFCLEPMLSMGSPNIKVSDDGWTISSFDNSITAHFEHSIAVTEKSYLVLTNI